MFTLTNPLLLWAFPVLALPWIFRRRQEERIQKLKFPLLQFLIESEQKERVNPLLQEWLLLVIRTLILALLLLTLAGPRWVNDAGVGYRLFSFLPVGQTFNSNVMIVDESYSMAYENDEANLWEEAATVSQRLESDLQGLSSQWVGWSRERLEANPSPRLYPLNASERQALFSQSPKRVGSDISALISGLDNSFQGNENYILITDGQRLPWQNILDENSDTLPPMLVVDISKGPVNNSWLEVDTLSSPPWGIADWETIAGSVYSLRETASEGNVTIVRPETGETVYSNSLSLPVSQEPAPIPFVFSARYSELSANQAGNENGSLSFALRLQPADGLAIDDSLELNVPTSDTFPVAVAGFAQSRDIVHRVLSSGFDAESTAGADQQNPAQKNPVQIWGPTQPELEGVRLLIASHSRVPYWDLSYSTRALEYIKAGGSMIVFAGTPDGANPEWQRFLTELGWQWQENDLQNTVSESGGGSIPGVSGLTVWGDDLLGQSLDAWPDSIWREWLSGHHGTIPGRIANPIISYHYGNDVRDLIVSRPMGDGHVWIVNTVLDEESPTLLSPALPAFLWEAAKKTARTSENIDVVMPQARTESNLTRLSTEEKAAISAAHPVQFTSPENLDEALDSLFGGTDLRMFLLLLTIGFALFESWLSNRLASL